MGLDFMAAASAEAGVTMRIARRSFREAKGCLRWTVTVVVSLASIESMKVKNWPKIEPSAVALPKAATTSSAVTSVPSENLAPSRREISYSVSDTMTGSPAARAGLTL